MPQILDDVCLESFVPLMIILICNYNYIANPYLVAKLIEVSMAFQWTKTCSMSEKLH